MLFDLKPKENAKDFFNYKDELNSLVGYLANERTRLVVIRGLRRTGKSSLLRVGLKKASRKFILIDARELSSPNRSAFESKVLEELKSLKGLAHTLLERLESVDAGVRISLKQDENMWALLKKLNPVFAVDEVQMLKGTGVESFFAALYDNTDCKIILTGSEVGVLDDFLGKENSKAPLFGRVHEEINTHPLAPEKSREFLALGFKQAGKTIPSEAMDKALKELDGIPGWTAMYGNLSLSSGPEVALKRTMAIGSKLAYSELESFLATRPAAKNRYLALCKLLATKGMAWAELKRAMQIELKEAPSDSQFSNYLESLVDYGFLSHEGKTYSIPDPLLKKALTGGISN